MALRPYEIEDALFVQFGKKWKMHPGTVRYIHVTLLESNSRYGKVSRRLVHVNIVLSARQLKYFARKVRLSKRVGMDAPNYNEVVNKRS